jgi:hypothetical protein
VFGKSRLCDTFILSHFSHFSSLFIRNGEITYMKDGETITLAPQSTPRSDSPTTPAPQTLPTDPPTPDPTPAPVAPAPMPNPTPEPTPAPTPAPNVCIVQAPVICQEQSESVGENPISYINA